MKSSMLGVLGCAALVASGLTVVASPASAARTTFSNPTAIMMPAGTIGAGNPYPSSITVGGMSGPITGVSVRLDGFSHTQPDDVDILLVAPSGEGVMVLSDACGTDDIVDVTWTFGDGPPILPVVPGSVPNETPPACDLFTYRPTNWEGPDIMPSPAPPGPYGASFAAFNDENPNGTWRLFVQHDQGPNGGQIARGWALTIETGPADAAVPGVGTSGVANPYPLTRTITGEDRLITDLNVTLDGIFHQNPDDLDVLLVGPTGASVVLMSDACGTFDVNAYGWEWDDEALNPMPDGGAANGCGTRTWRPRDYEPGEPFVAPAPIGPHGSSLAAFDLTDPRGEWRLFVQDDTADNAGFFTSRFALQVQTRPRAAVEFNTDSVQVAEGETRALTLTRTAAAPLAAATVSVATAAGSATSGADYTPVSGTLSFAPGQTELTVPVDALIDAASEGDETYAVSIGSPDGDARLGGLSLVTVTIPDTSPPQTTIDRGPKRKTQSRKAKLHFSSSEAGSTFECKLDKRAWKPCSSPTSLRKLKVGTHVLRVRATDAAGNVDPTPAKRAWRVTKR